MPAPFLNRLSPFPRWSFTLTGIHRHLRVVRPRGRCIVNRRDFLQAGAAGAALAAAAPVASAASRERPRVGLIGCGWYGKIDLLRLIQIAPVEVVALCDVDRRMLSEAADLVASR